MKTDFTCPRCEHETLVGIPGRGQKCSNRICKWPHPEPGIITTLRFRPTSEKILQRLRSKGLWPR